MRRHKAEGRRQKAEGRRQKAKVENALANAITSEEIVDERQIVPSFCLLAFCLLPSVRN
jgi:hypothetical protein